MSSKKHYKKLDLIRFVACIAVLLYHLGLLKGGYLAVCTFFVLSGYLSCKSAFDKEKLSLKKYYANLFTRIYLPLIIVVFLSIFVISFFDQINWINLKPETTSVLLGYNNYWQLGANLDYFARHVSSPFMHLWYIAILLQFDIAAPFLFMLLKKMGNNKRGKLVFSIGILLSLICTGYFGYMAYTKPVMIVYYDTLSRLFSLIFGVLIGLLHYYFKPISTKNNKWWSKFFYCYLIMSIILFIIADSSLPIYPIAMIVTSLVTWRLIDYSVKLEDKKNPLDKIVNFISTISYEIYLISYPIIFIFEYISIEDYLKVLLITILTIVISYIIHYFLKKRKALGIIGKSILAILCTIGLCQFIIAKDYTSEMKGLEQELSKNQELMQQKQEAYEQKLKEEQNNWNLTLENLELEGNSLKDLIYTIPVVGVGDSVMLGAVSHLYTVFPNGYFDAAVSRTAWKAGGILRALKNNKLLGEVIILNLGANGDCPESCKIEIMKICENRKVFWVNTTNRSTAYVNDNLIEFSKKYNNLYVVDWNLLSKDHPEYFLADKIHLTPDGVKAYSQMLYDKIYEVYLKEYNDKKDALLNQYEQNQKQKVSFYGNDLLLNMYDYLSENFSGANFTISDDFETLVDQLEKAKTLGTLNNRVLFAFDDSYHLEAKDYQKLVDVISGHEVYIVVTNNKKIDIENTTVINAHEKVKSHFMVDQIHLTPEGSIILSQEIENTLISK